MLTAVHVHNELGGVLQLPMDALATDSEYVIEGIDGLEPVKADIVTNTFVTMDGGAFQNARRTQRNIVIVLGFNPSFATTDPYGELRRSLYSYFAPKSKVRLQFLSSNLETVEAVGFVESFESSIFSREPKVQISVICPDPYFYSLNDVVARRIGAGVIDVTNPGSVDVGLTVYVNGIVSLTQQLYIKDNDADVKILNYTGPLYVNGEPLVLRFVGTQGQKSAQWEMGAQQTPPYNINTPWTSGVNVLGYVDAWPSVHPGVNHLQYMVQDAAGNNELVLVFRPRYLGL
jgi:hypothetical protein